GSQSRSRTMSHIAALANPYDGGSGYVQDQPASLPVFPFAKPASDLGKQAAELHKAAQAATARLQECRDAQNDAISRYRAAQAALQAEIARGAQDGIDADREAELSLEVSASERLADPGTHQLRYRVAVAKQRETITAYQSWVWEHYLELIEAEVRPQADAASK